MEYNVRDDAMRLVVNYLSSEDLKNASSTCRSWSQLIDDETERKGPRLVTQEIIINRYNRAVAKNENVFFSTDMKPLLLFIFTNKNCNSDIAIRHICKVLPIHCVLAELKRNIFEDVNTVWTVLIPYTCHLKIDALNFVTRSSLPISERDSVDFTREKPSLDGKELPNSYVETHNGLDVFCSEKYIYEGVSSSSFCTILFCTYSEIPALKNIIERFSIWYPNAGPIWGCTLESLDVFSTTFNILKKQYDSDILQIFISDKDLVAKFLILNEDCNTKEKIQKEFEDLKNEINLKKYSIAFMCTPVVRYKDFYEIESIAFKEVFPEVTLAHIFSGRPFGAKNYNEFNKYLIDIEPHVGNNVTTFLLLTYY